LIGIDGVFGGDGVFLPVEVNPRYTASVEILERDTRRDLVDEHIRVCQEPGKMPSWPTFVETYSGKAILYAPIDFTFPAAGPWDDDYPFADLRRRFADLPHPGQPIRRGQPVLTFFADGDSPASTEAALRKIAGDLDRLLFGR
jgi:predicted ATP-grasp superfamily ATP-dependent carboligase